MRILYIKLVKYKRFALTHKDVFEHHFHKKLTMVLGPNGSGKSSLMSELSPLPASKDDFDKGGMKEIHIEHDGIFYRLISDFTGTSAKYLFYEGEENLNASMNVSTQRELAFQHFNLVPVVQDLLTGAENFTEMSLINRKKLFTAITHLNIDSILENYNQLKEQLKSQEFLLKNTTSLMMTERNKLSDPHRIDTLKRQKDNCRTLLEALLQFRTEVHQYSRVGDLSAAQRTFKERCDAWQVSYERAYPYITVYPYEQLSALRESSLATIAQVKTQMGQHYSRIEALEQQIDALKMSQLQDTQSLQTQRTALLSEQSTLQSSLVFLTPEDYHDSVTSAVLMLEHSLSDVIHHLPANPDKRLGRGPYEELLARRSGCLVQANQLLQQEISQQELIQELQDHANYNCPNCHHSWLPSEVQSKLTQTQTALTQTRQHKQQVQLELQNLVKPIQEQEEYLEIYSRFASLFNASKTPLKTFWSAVIGTELHYRDPNAISALLRKLQMDVTQVARLRAIASELKHTEHQLSIMQGIGEQSLQQLIDARWGQEELLRECHSAIERQQQCLKDYDTTKWHYEHLHQLQRLVQQTKQAVHEEHLRHTVSAVVRETDDELSKLKVQLIEIDKELTGHHLIEQMIANYETQIQQIQEDVKVLTILTDELSPKNGFIAQCISNFLNVIITSINHEIAKVWDYKMELKVIDVQEDTLNYKFKVVVEDRLEIEDISKVSSGMKEIINLGMKKTLFKLLKLEGYPMALDEFGVKLDQIHRAKIADTIFKMVGSELYSQIFLITHLDLAYTDFKDTETIDMAAL